MQCAAEKSFGVLIPKEDGNIQVEGSGNTSLLLKLHLQNTKSSIVILDMCGYKTRYLKDLQAPGKKQQQSTNPAEVAISKLVQYMSQASRHQITDKVISIYRSILGNRKLSFVLHLSETVQLAQVQPVLNLAEKYFEQINIFL